MAIVLIGLIFSCRKDEFYSTSGVQLEFSTDTILFDTIFSGIGSATKHLKVYNRSSQNVEISEISVGKGEQSKYHLNINGMASNQATSIKLRAKDSMYIFVQVYINTKEDALLEQDSIVFKMSDGQQEIKLIAWGQDVHLINGEIIKTSTWNNDKPYLVYNSMLVDTNQTLTIDPGTKIYFHRRSRMYVAGTLEINGTFEQPVTLQGDRLEEMYSDVPGQWNGIWLMNGSKHNSFNFTTIKNAIIGIQVDTLADKSVPTLSLSNSRIEHMSYAGIFAQGSTIFATNCLIADCAYYNVALTIGGSYDFYHCTLANFWQNSFRETASLMLNNYYTYNDQPIIRDITHAGFYNCLVWGDHENEISIDAYPDKGILSYEFDHCLLKYTSDSELDISKLSSCLNNKDPLFSDTEKYDFQLDTIISPAVNQASRARIDEYPLLLNFDILQKSRILDMGPDIGVFEFGK
jgi:hypothetical protein